MVRSVQRRRRASTPPAAVPLTADDDSVDAIRCVNPSPAKPPQHPEDTVDRLAITAASSPGGRPPDSDHDGESADCDSMTRLAAQSLARTPSPPRMPKRTLRRAMSTSLLNLPTFFNPRASQAGAMATRPETPFEPSFGRGAATSRTPAGTLHAVMSSSPIKGTSTDRKRTKRGAKKTRTTPHRDQIRAALTKRTFGLATASKLMSAAKAAVSEAVTAVKERKKVGRKRPRYSEASARSADAKEEEALAAAVVAAEAITSTSSRESGGLANPRSRSGHGPLTPPRSPSHSDSPEDTPCRSCLIIRPAPLLQVPQKLEQPSHSRVVLSPQALSSVRTLLCLARRFDWSASSLRSGGGRVPLLERAEPQAADSKVGRVPSSDRELERRLPFPGPAARGQRRLDR